MQDVQSALCLVITAASPGLLPAGCRRLDPWEKLWWSLSRSLFPPHHIPVPTFIHAGGNTQGQECPAYIKLVKYSIRVETPRTPISHLIRNQPAMEADTCGFFMLSEVSLHLAENDATTGSAHVTAHFLLFLFFCLHQTQKKNHVLCISFFFKIWIICVVLNIRYIPTLCWL